jgi:hypothetical protein
LAQGAAVSVGLKASGAAGGLDKCIRLVYGVKALHQLKPCKAPAPLADTFKKLARIINADTTLPIQFWLVLFEILMILGTALWFGHLWKTMSGALNTTGTIAND